MRLPFFCRKALIMLGIFVFGLSAATAADWPRQVTDSKGSHTLDHKPLRIVSTSVTLTGSLLAIDAPVVASGATTPNNRFADDQGFYASGAKWRNRVTSRVFILASRMPKPLPPRCRI